MKKQYGALCLSRNAILGNIFNPTFVASSAYSSVTNCGIQVSTVLNGNSLYVFREFIYTQKCSVASISRDPHFLVSRAVMASEANTLAFTFYCSGYLTIF
jgi:hypothetical protein